MQLLSVRDVPCMGVLAQTHVHLSCVSVCVLAALLKDLGVVLNATQLAQAISQLDTAQTGRISFGEFLLWWKG